jgi:F-type H+-transporting ATPase subunit b
MIAALLVFGIVFFVLARFVWPKISQGLDARAEKIRNEIEAAELAQQQAKSALAQYEKNLADARAEAQKMLDDTKAQQAALAADLKAKADAELSAMREKARHDIDIAKRAAINEIYAEASGLATTIAGKILKRDLNPGDQARLVEESLAEMKSLARAN